MHTYTPQTFTIPSIPHISERSITEHLELYRGYVTNYNALTERAETLLQNSESDALTLSELVRRRSFEFGGMKLHEHYFSQLEGGAAAHNPSSAFAQTLTQQFGTYETAFTQLRRIAATRGPGWALLYYDPESLQYILGFTGEQHQGHFATLPIILALDVWEHAYILDHGALGKMTYVDAYLSALHHPVLEKRFDALRTHQ